MFKAVTRIAAMAALSAGLALASATPANAAVTVTLTPSTAAAGTTVTVIAASCEADSVTAAVEDTGLSVSLPTAKDQAVGSFTVPNDWRPGTYTVTVECGEDKASAPLTVTGGTGAATGGGSAASDPTAAIALTGAAAIVIALAGLWILKRRSRIAA